MVEDRCCTVFQRTPTKLRKRALRASGRMRPSIVVVKIPPEDRMPGHMALIAARKRHENYGMHYANVPLHFNIFNFVFRFCIGFLRSITNWASPYFLDFCYSHYYFSFGDTFTFRASSETQMCSRRIGCVQSLAFTTNIFEYKFLP